MHKISTLLSVMNFSCVSDQEEEGVIGNRVTVP